MEIELFNNTNNVYSNKDNINGEIFLTLNDRNVFSYASLTVELIGQIETDAITQFMNIKKEIDSDGEVYQRQSHPFSFSRPGFVYETYNGEKMKIKYLVRAIITKKIFGTKLSVDKSFDVKCSLEKEQYEQMIFSRMNYEIGFKGLYLNTHIDFEMSKNKFNIEEEAIEGNVKFINIENVPITSIDVYLMKTEKIMNKSDNYIISKYELCDGQPWRGDSIPIRFYLNNYKLSPTMKTINNSQYSVRYYIKIVVYCEYDSEDEANGQLSKMFEIVLYRYDRTI